MKYQTTNDRNTLAPSGAQADGAKLFSRQRIAVIVPCYNEEVAIPSVIRDFKSALPAADIYVYDNASKDRTSAVAAEAGAIVRFEPRKGKGNVVRRMLSDVDADIFILVDGDNTYDAAAAPDLVQRLLAERLDMVIGARKHTNAAAYRAGHRLGNRMLTGLVTTLFNVDLRDMLSGYRVMSRPFVKSFPALSRGYEIETELTVHAFEIGAAMAEVDTAYKERPAGSVSKLNTVRDGIRILRFIARLLREERPMEFFGGLAILLIGLSGLIAAPVIAEFMTTGLVPRLPTWVLAMAMALSGFGSLVCGLVLDTVTKGRLEMRRLAYLAQKRPD